MEAPKSPLIAEVLANPESAKSLQQAMFKRKAFDDSISFNHNGQTILLFDARFAPVKEKPKSESPFKKVIGAIKCLLT